MSAKHTPMVVAAAREICRLSAEACGIDNEDSWKIHGDGFLNEAEQVLQACGAPELLEAAQAIEFALRMPGVSAAEVLDENSPIREGLRAAIAKAGGA